MNAEHREEILSDEFIRPQPLGIRPLSVGVLKLCRKLGLSTMTPSILGAPEATPEQLAREMIVIAWLLDERHSIEDIKTAADRGGREWVYGPELDDYEFALEPALLMTVRAEVGRTNAAVSLALVKVVSKPGSASAPPGNS